jgi:hypothetical protein
VGYKAGLEAVAKKKEILTLPGIEHLSSRP